MYDCKFAPAGSVQCERRECAKCGWNPEVAKARLDEIIEKMIKESKEREQR